MPTGTIYKYNKNRKFSVIKPDEWKTGRIDVLFETATFETKLGEKVQYDYSERNGKRYAQNIKKIGT
jgi:cold shock CspA family protein